MVSSQDAAIGALLQRSGRDALPLRRTFVQQGDAKKCGGPLSRFGKRHVALDVYLLAHLLASQPPWDVELPAKVWARLLGLAENDSSTTLITRQWNWLEVQKLVRTERDGRARRVFILDESGDGRGYRHPGVASESAAAEGHYFQVSDAYWRAGWHQRLSMSAKIVLLIALSLQDDFILPVEHAAKWYSLSATRIHDGLSELRTLGLLEMRVVSRSAPLTERGVTFERHYAVRAPLRAAPQQSSDD